MVNVFIETKTFLRQSGIYMKLFDVNADFEALK